MGLREGEGEKHAGSAVSDGETGEAAEDGEDDAFGEELTDDAYALGAEGGADGHLRASAHATNEQEVRDVGAGDEEDESGDPLEQLERRGVVFLHRLDASAGRDEAGVDLGQAFGVFGALVVLVVCGEGLAEGDVDLLFESLLIGRRGSDTRFEAADDIEPPSPGVVGELRIGEWNSADDGKVVFGWSAGEAVSEEALRGD